MTETAPTPIKRSSRATSALAIALMFVATRAFNVLLWKIPHVSFVQNDVSYYGYWLWCLLGDGSQNPQCATALAGPGVMTEYPLPAVWFLEFLYTLGGGHPWWLPFLLLGGLLAGIVPIAVLWNQGHRKPALLGGSALIILLVAVWFSVSLPYRATAFNSWLPVFASAMLLLDGIVAAMLFRYGSVGATVFWILFIGACGPIVWFRFDMLTAAAVALACLWLNRHPAISGALIGLGAAIKLWPALLIAPMSAPAPLHTGKGRLRLIGFVAAGFSLGLASLLIGGWSRSTSPMIWQSNRGLQMESIPATALVFLRTFTTNPAWQVALSKYNAIEFQGPAVDVLLGLSTFLTAGSLLLTVALAWRLLRKFHSNDEGAPQAILLSVLAVTLATVIANKTLSTQYVQWLAGPLAALLALKTSPWLRRPRRVLATGLVLVAVLTQYTYPWGTLGIMAIPNGSGFESSTLVARNVLLVLLAGFATGLAWRATSSPTRVAVAEVR
ncbi:glycosyltransferase 87 family protein [[Pseudopropionibacterium] massiliense]|uniref:glycosyltransferase 87 family protein n=1 Tax=[Pseudopropionibacterium] massiliense TaxID=2220000 RepID=UPI0010317234|nr:glycosyltransferase 87 family protein [[Pseudopropionibacterium] massiliense]